MSQKPGYHSRSHQSPYPRHSPSPISTANESQPHEPRFEDGRRPRDHEQDPHGNAAAPGGDAAVRGPRHTAEGGPGMTYVCIEVLGGGSNGSGGEGGGGRGDGVEGTNEGWHLAGGPCPAASTLAWGANASQNPEVPNWPPGTSLQPWQGYSPPHETHVWPSKYPYAPGRSEFANPWCGHQNPPYAPPTQHPSPIPPSGGHNTYIPQPVMWGPEYMDQWRYNQSRKRSFPTYDGTDLGKKTSTLNFLEPTSANEQCRKSPEHSKETVPFEQQSCLEELAHLDRSRRTDKGPRHTSKGAKKQSAQCKASLSTPLLTPVSKSPEPPNTPECTILENDVKHVQRVQSDESFIRAPTVDRTAYFLRRSHRIRGNDKRALEPDNMDNMKAGKMIKPPKPIKPVKAFKLLKSIKPDCTLDSTAILPLNASQNVRPNKVNQPNTSKGTRQSLVIPPKDVSSVNGVVTEIPIKRTQNSKPLDSVREIPPMKGTADTNRSTMVYRQMSPDKYNKSLKPNKLSALDAYKRCDDDNVYKGKNLLPHDSEEAVKLVVPNNSHESYQFEDINNPLDRGDAKMTISQNQSRENIIINEDPFKGYDSVESERGLGDIPLKIRRSPDRGKQNQRKRRTECDRKNLAESEKISHDEKESCSMFRTLERSIPSSIPRPQRSATESTFRVPQCRCRRGCPLENQRDAAVNIGPRMRTNTTQTDDIEDELGNLHIDHSRPHSNRWPSACSGSYRPNSQISKETSSAVTSNEATRGSGYNQFSGTDASFEPYFTYRSSMPFQNSETINPMMYGGFSPDPFSVCSNGAPRLPFWGPTSFPGYGMPMSIPMQMAMHMCMPMGMPITMPCPYEASGTGVETRQRVDAAVGDSREDNSLNKEEANIVKSKSKSYFMDGNDIVNLENYTPSAKKKMELLLAGLTPRGKTLHPERLNSLLSEISPEVIKKFLDESPSEETSSTSRNEVDNIIKEETIKNTHLLNTSENIFNDDTDNTGIKEKVKILNKKDTLDKTSKIVSEEQNELIKKSELKQETEMNVKEYRRSDEIAASQEPEKEYVENKGLNLSNNNKNKMEDKKEGENVVKRNKSKSEDVQEIKAIGNNKYESNVAQDKENKYNTNEKNDDNKINCTSMKSIHPPLEPIHIKIRTRPLFRNQDIREDFPTRVNKMVLSASTDTLSSTTSINPDTSISDITTLEAVDNTEAINSPKNIEVENNSTKDITCSEDNLQTRQVESIKDVIGNKVDVSVEVKPEQNEQSISTSVDTREGNQYNVTVQYMERRYSISPCPGVTFTSSQQASWDSALKSRPTSPSRPVTVSPLRPLPRPIPLPRFTAPPPLAPRRRRQVALNEGGSASANNLHAPQRGGTIRPPRARIPARLLQSSTLSTDTDTAKKSCPWSRLSFVERTALARALVDSSSCTVKVGDATVLLARSGLSSLMTIAEGILQQSRPTRTPASQSDRRAAKSPKRSPIRVNPSPPPERRKITTVDINQIPIGVNPRDLSQQKIFITERRVPHVKRLVADPGRSSSAGNHSSGSGNSAKKGKLETKPKQISSASRGRFKGPVNLTPAIQNDAVLRKEKKGSPDREVKKSIRTGRYCSMRIAGSSIRSESPVLLTPPRGFRGRGVRSFGVVSKRGEGKSVVDKGVSVSKEVNAKGYAIFPWRGTKEMLFDSNSSISTLCIPKSLENVRGKITKCKSQNEETKKSLETNAMKSKSLHEESRYSRMNKKDISVLREIGKMRKDLSDNIWLLQNLAKKCKSLAVVDSSLTVFTTSKLSCSPKRSSSFNAVKINESEKMTKLTFQKVVRCPDRLTRSGNILYRPPGYTGSRQEYESKNMELNSSIPEQTATPCVKETPTKSIRTPSRDSKQELPTKSTSEQRHVNPINSAPPPRSNQNKPQTVRMRLWADDFCIPNPNPKRHISFAERRPYPRLPVTAVAASQRSVTRSRSHVTAPPNAHPTSSEGGDGGATVADSRNTARARSSSPVRTPPTPWRDKRITNHVCIEQSSSK